MYEGANGEMSEDEVRSGAPSTIEFVKCSNRRIHAPVSYDREESNHCIEVVLFMSN